VGVASVIKGRIESVLQSLRGREAHPDPRLTEWAGWRLRNQSHPPEPVPRHRCHRTQSL